MIKGKFVSLEENKKDDYELLLKDNNGFIIGRCYILDINEKDEFSLLRFNYYKSHEDIDLIANCLEVILEYFFEYEKMNKINLILDENFNTEITTMLGFTLEGFLFDTKVVDNYYSSEMIFGMDYECYKGSFIRNNLDIKGKKISLKILTPKYANELLDYCIRNKSHLKAYEPVREESYFKLEHQRRLIMEDYRNYLNGKLVNFGIFRNDKLIGKIKISSIVLGSFRSGIIGYSIDEKEQGNGYMKEAVKLAIEYAFNELDLHRIEASAMIDNIKSQRVLKSCNFKELGLNEKYLFINGEWRDHITFYMIK